MELEKLTKKELIQILQEKEELIAQAEFFKQEYEAAKKLKDQVIESEFQLKKEIKNLKNLETIEINKLKADLESRERDIKVLADNNMKHLNRFNELATLFDEYIQALDDQYAINQLFLRNSKTTIELLKGKVQKFNEGDTNK